MPGTSAASSLAAARRAQQQKAALLADELREYVSMTHAARAECPRHGVVPLKGKAIGIADVP